MPIELTKISRLQAHDVHGVDDGSSLSRHVAGKIGIHHVPALHCGTQRAGVKHIALEGFHPSRSGFLSLPDRRR